MTFKEIKDLIEHYSTVEIYKQFIEPIELIDEVLHQWVYGGIPDHEALHEIIKALRNAEVWYGSIAETKSYLNIS